MGHDIVLACAACGTRNRVLVDRLAEQPACGQCKAPLIDAGHPLELDDTSFFEVIASSKRPVLVDFWAAWCGPCRTFAPNLERFAQEHAGNVLVVKVNVDQARAVAARHQIRSIPTIAVFMHGKEAARHVGGMSVPELKQFVSVAA